MIRLTYLFSLLTLLNLRSCLLGKDGCRLLADLCKEDPNCADERVFYRTCLKKYVLNNIGSEEGTTAWDSDSDWIKRKPPEQPRYQYHRTNVYLNEPVYEIVYDSNDVLQEIEKRKSGEYKKVPLDQKDFEERNKQKRKVQELQKVYEDYKKESLRESVSNIRTAFNIHKENDFIKNKHIQQFLDYRNKESKEQSQLDTDEVNKKHSTIINDAFELINALTSKRNTEEKRTKDTRTLLKNKKESLQEFHKKENIKKKENTEFFNNNNSIAKDEFVDVNYAIDREEVAVPVVLHSDPDKKGAVEDKGYIIIHTSARLTDQQAVHLGENLQDILWNIKAADRKIFTLKKVLDNSAKFHIVTQSSWFESVDTAKSIATKINTDSNIRDKIKTNSGIIILSAAVAHPASVPISKVPTVADKDWDKLTLFTAVIGGCTLGLVVIAITVCSVKRRRKDSTPVGFKKQEAVQDYQELCRTQMSVVNSPRPDDEAEGMMKDSWNGNSFAYNMDITTGHVILAYMEDHLKNENRLNKEWEALCSYKADENESNIGSDQKNTSKNRYRDVLPYDHNRVTLCETSNLFHSDFINASFITDIDPRNPDYIAAQGPLDNTIADFWQMIWEQGIVVIVNLTKLSDMGLPQCHRYWPEDGSEVYHIYEVHLISEHIWCDDYLVRSLYLKNLQTEETRTITQFHYLTWPDLSIPNCPKPLLEFRRKVNKCYRGHACPIIVHCNNGVGRTGTYILLDMVLKKMIKGAKEIDIAATLEHLRDQRPDMVKTKGQFEFALTAIAEEVTSILSAIPR